MKYGLGDSFPIDFEPNESNFSSPMKKIEKYNNVNVYERKKIQRQPIINHPISPMKCFQGNSPKKMNK